ncbi:hypothetical protein MODO_3354 [Myroides odoratimimus]|nr:hypothetical protein MODO_3354 [Myroides odoratimimus]
MLKLNVYKTVSKSTLILGFSSEVNGGIVKLKLSFTIKKGCTIYLFLSLNRIISTNCFIIL